MMRTSKAKAIKKEAVQTQLLNHLYKLTSKLEKERMLTQKK